MFFHPHPVDIDGMITYAFTHQREKDLLEIQNVVGKEYSRHQQKRVMKKNANTKALPLKGEYRNDHQPGLIDINMRDYRDYSRPSAKCFRDVCQDSINRYGLESSIRKDRVAKLQPVPLKQPKKARSHNVRCTPSRRSPKDRRLYTTDAFIDVLSTAGWNQIRGESMVTEK